MSQPTGVPLNQLSYHDLQIYPDYFPFRNDRFVDIWIDTDPFGINQAEPQPRPELLFFGRSVGANPGSSQIVGILPPMNEWIRLAGGYRLVHKVNVSHPIRIYYRYF